jgi:hypothetical protein
MKQKNIKKCKLPKRQITFLRMLYSKNYVAVINKKIIKNPFSIPTYIYNGIKIHKVIDILFVKDDEPERWVRCIFLVNPAADQIYMAGVSGRSSEDEAQEIKNIYNESEFFDDIDFFRY